jgi:hypothetical protein
LEYPTTTATMRKRLESILADKDYNTLVARDAEQIVGFIGIRVGALYESDIRAARSWHWRWRRTISDAELADGCYRPLKRC